MRVTLLSALMAVLVADGMFPPERTHVVRLQANRFVPAETRAAPGDTIRFVNGNGGPHNVEFMKDSIVDEAEALIDAAMTGNKIRFMSGPLLLTEEETYVMVVPRIPAGRYAFICLPHQATNMSGALVVAP